MKRLKSIKDLKSADYNPRKITTEALAGLTASTKKFGDLSGIVFNKKTGRLVAGHQRVKVLTERGGELKSDKDGVRVEMPDGETFPVRVVNWDKGKEKLANISANNPHIEGDFTSDLESLLGDLLESEGFDDLRLDSLLGNNSDLKEEKPEVEFSARLDEASNYLVLYFETETDWLQAKTLFDVKPVNASYPTGKKHTTGVGRVIDGSKAIEKILKTLGD